MVQQENRNRSMEKLALAAENMAIAHRLEAILAKSEEGSNTVTMEAKQQGITTTIKVAQFAKPPSTILDEINGPCFSVTIQDDAVHSLSPENWPSPQLFHDEKGKIYQTQTKCYVTKSGQGFKEEVVTPASEPAFLQNRHMLSYLPNVPLDPEIAPIQVTRLSFEQAVKLSSEVLRISTTGRVKV